MRVNICIILALINVVTIYGTDNSDDRSRTLLRKMIARRREEHFILQKNVAKNPNYEQRYQLVKAALKKVFELIGHHQKEITKLADDKMSESSLILIENTCLLMDFFLNFNYLIYTAIDKLEKRDWADVFQWCLDYTERNVDLLDAISTKELYFVQENFKKLKNYHDLENPFENNLKEYMPTVEAETEFLKKKKQRERKKLRKGPQMVLPPMKFEL